MSAQRVVIVMPAEMVAALDERAAVEERSRASLIRRLVHSGLTSSLPGAVDVPALVETAGRSSASLSLAHSFKPQPGNALRCECGTRKGDHK